MLDFKLNYYFETYKDSSVISSTKFKEEFRKKHGEFELLNELIIMIYKYQIKKYGMLVEDGKITLKRAKKHTYSNRENAKNLRIFGTREERMRRRLENARK